MMRRALLAAMLACPLIAQNPDGVDFFEKKIRPVLVNKCYACHSANAKPLMGRLLLDSRQGMARGGGSGQPAVTPNKPSFSW